jgi:hypothetical protein
MYIATILPTLPIEESDTAMHGFRDYRNQSFIDESLTAEMIDDWTQSDWQEQRFFGEDFAGREEYVQQAAPQIALVGRQELGPFYSRPLSPEIIQPRINCRPTLKPSRIEQLLQAEKIRRRAIAAGIVAAVILSAALIGAMLSPNTPDASGVPNEELIQPHLVQDGTGSQPLEWQSSDLVMKSATRDGSE